MPNALFQVASPLPKKTPVIYDTLAVLHTAWNEAYEKKFPEYVHFVCNTTEEKNYWRLIWLCPDWLKRGKHVGKKCKCREGRKCKRERGLQGESCW
jgi:hypothetical protein